MCYNNNMEKITLEETKAIINKIFSQANLGFIEVDTTDSAYNGTWKYHSKFYTKVGDTLIKNGDDIFKATNKAKNSINENDFFTPIIQIPDIEIFARLTQTYLQIAENFYIADKQNFSYYDHTFRERLFLDLITNTTNFDRNNILSYIENRTKMLENVLQTQSFQLGEIKNYTLKADLLKNPSMLEAPYRFTSYFIDTNKDKFILPTITFGLIADTAYIFAIQAKKEKQTNYISKELDRFFRKTNKDVDMQDIIGQVSPNALVALTIFLSAMKKEGIKKVVAPNFMPIRYQTNLMGEEYFFNQNGKGLLEEQSLEQIQEKHNRQQFGITNKFTYTLLRYCYHFDGTKFDYDDIRQQSVLTITKENKPQDNLINEIDKLCSHPLGIRDFSKQKTI